MFGSAARERLLRDAVGDEGPETELAGLLAAATVPARPDEVAGLHSALSAFRRAHRTQPAARRRAVPARILSTKAAVALVVALLGGVAFAAATGTPSVHSPSERPTTVHIPAGTSPRSLVPPTGTARTSPASTTAPSPTDSRKAPNGWCSPRERKNGPGPVSSAPPGRKTPGHCTTGRPPRSKATPSSQRPIHDQRSPMANRHGHQTGSRSHASRSAAHTPGRVTPGRHEGPDRSDRGRVRP
ncbi:hypothetical protein [Actinomadura alba]|uniref:Uncharacterized protein n=1 Tax=Actinomadura alba TaxID=406431 RepID=A0ABR7LYV3_9ACTN|nr:hypothetical protein [Actinomadura alba]MBC6469677.1 hypothetical protein [Actinomadura alba]